MVKKPVDQNPRSITSPLPKEGNIPRIREKRYIKRMPITKVGKDTPKRETAKIVSLRKLLRLIPVYTPKNVPKSGKNHRNSLKTTNFHQSL